MNVSHYVSRTDYRQIFDTIKHLSRLAVEASMKHLPHNRGLAWGGTPMITSLAALYRSWASSRSAAAQ